VDLKSGKILWAQNDTMPRPPASLTKIATALVTLEIANLEDRITITPEARTAPGGRMYAEAGWSFSVRDTLYGLMLQSGNDAAIALAQALSPDGSIEGFMKILNERVDKLGAHSTRFSNPHGYDQDGHSTTARDLALITMIAMRNPVFAEMVASKTRDVPWGDGTPHTFINHNKLLWQYEGTVGIKTGFTDAAGHCLASAVTRGNDTLVAILLGSPNHYAETKALYDWAFPALPALRANPVGIVRQVPKAAAAEQTSVEHGLEIVQLNDLPQASDFNADPSSAPLLAPAIALAAAVVAGTLISRRRRRPAAVAISPMIEEFEETMAALQETASPTPQTVGVD
jgi:D-alanyl-D-alanine carboxypeptidase